MPRAHVSFFTNINKSQIINSDKHFEIRGVPVTVDNAVMNGLLYSAEENEKGMPSLIDRVVTLSHPKDAKGNSRDAYEGEALMNFFSGGSVTNTYAENGVRKADIKIAKHILKAQDEANGTTFYNMLENKEAIGVSTGLYTNIAGEPGTNESGQEYSGIASDQEYNHLAMLTSDEPPAGGSETFMRFNSDTEQHMVVNLADYIDAELPEEIKADDKPLMNWLRGVFAKFANEKPTNYNEGCKDKFTHKQNEGLSMAHIDALAAKLGLNTEEVTALSDSELTAKLDGLASVKAPEVNTDAIQALVDEVKGLKEQFTVQSNAKKDGLLADLKANKKHGLSESMLGKLDVNELQELHDKHCSTTNGLNGNALEVNDQVFSAEMPNVEVK